MLSSLRGVNNDMWPLIKIVASSRVGQVLCLTNLGLINYCYLFIMKVPLGYVTIDISSVGNSGFIAGRWVDFDSSLLLVLTVLNVLPVLFSNLVIALFTVPFPQSDVILTSWIYAALLLALIIIQWLIVGSFIGRMVKLYRDSRTEAPHLTRG
jgi:hypothetical protein